MLRVGPLQTNKGQGIYAYGFERPSAIQQRAIMPVIKGKWQTHGSSSFFFSSPGLLNIPATLLQAITKFLHDIF